MTNFDMIKGMNEYALAKFLMQMEYRCVVPKKYICNESYCINCKEKLSCFTEWLKQEVRDYREVCKEESNG